MSKELRFCLQFTKCYNRACFHRKKRIRKKNYNRAIHMMFHTAVKRWGVYRCRRNGDEMIYTEVKSDVFDYHNKGYYLVHCVSADFKLGAGIAKKFEKKFHLREDFLYAFGETWYKHYRNTTDGAVFLHGQKHIIDLVTKERYWHKPTMYVMECCLRKLREGCLQKGINKLAMPKIGCGLDKLNWGKVSALIQEIFADTDIEIVVCYL